jgi:hypothetical protein
MLLLMLSLLVSLCICCKAPVYVLCVVRAILFEATACSSIYVLVLILSLSLSHSLLSYLSRLSLYIRSYVLLLLPGVFMSCRAHCWLGYHCRVNGVA